MRCDHCANDVPDGVFCTSCGAHEGTTSEAPDPRRREHRFAAHPGEHVAHPSVFTTIFPHLGHHKLHEFRWAFWAGLAGVVVLTVAGLVSAAILVSTFLVPVLYLIYLYEAQVYRDEPASVLGFTVGGGALLGIVLYAVESRFIPATAGALGLNAGTFIVLGVLIPLVQEVLKPLPALALRTQSDFPETIDGLVFGVAAGLGFALADGLLTYSSAIAYLPVRVDPGNWIITLITLAVLQPLLQGTTTGAIVAAIWRRQRGSLGRREVFVVGLAVVAHVVFSSATLLIGAASVFALVVQAAVVGGLTVYLRYVLHHALLEEAAHMGFAETVCANCHRHIVASGFCPHCGMALTASPHRVRRARKPRAAVKENA
jgi:RsiW-degrading membrane proteinase PrsW (M82 family)